MTKTINVSSTLGLRFDRLLDSLRGDGPSRPICRDVRMARIVAEWEETREDGLHTMRLRPLQDETTGAAMWLLSEHLRPLRGYGHTVDTILPFSAGEALALEHGVPSPRDAWAFRGGHHARFVDIDLGVADALDTLTADAQLDGEY